MLLTKCAIFLGITFGFIASVFAAPSIHSTLDTVKGGGFGGNPKIGFYSYDGQDGQHPALDMMRDNANSLCYWQNANIRIRETADYRYNLILTPSDEKPAEDEFFMRAGENDSLIYSVITPQQKLVVGLIKKTELYDQIGDAYDQFLEALNKKNLEKVNYFFPEILSITSLRGDTLDPFSLQVAQFKCDQPNNRHENIYWNTLSTDPKTEPKNTLLNDAFYYANATTKLFQDWFGIPLAIDKDGNSIAIDILLSSSMEDEWDNDLHIVRLKTGNETDLHSPGLTLIAHELGHAFTHYHSKLGSESEPNNNPDIEIENTPYQSLALDESFADMTAQAVEFYLTGKNDWKIGGENTIRTDAIRYMNNPPLDCKDNYPSKSVYYKNICSIDHMKDLDKVSFIDENGKRGMEEHYLAGVFNKAFYLLSTSPGWDTKKAYVAMVDANRYYWTNTTDFTEAACGVLKAIQARNNNPSDVAIAIQVFSQVGIDADQCNNK